jgi:5-methylcytosine-specific restriction endonuclease McrA
MADRPAPLPEPDSDELRSLIGSSVHRLLYSFLYRRRDNPPTMIELRFFVGNQLGEDQSQTDRRVRDPRRYFYIPAERDTRGVYRYRLAGWTTRPTGDQPTLSLRVRAQVLQSQRCAQCGRTPTDDAVKLVVDHKIPQSWGGTNSLDNLQPLCEDCNAGKRDYFRSFQAHADKIRSAITYAAPQRRVGELLKAFESEWVRSDLLGIVASAKEFQEDWQRRLRDLRYLGWDYEHQKRYGEGPRVWSYYRLLKSAPWPQNISAAIRAEEHRRKRARRDRSARPGSTLGAENGHPQWLP